MTAMTAMTGRCGARIAAAARTPASAPATRCTARVIRAVVSAPVTAATAATIDQYGWPMLAAVAAAPASSTATA